MTRFIVGRATCDISEKMRREMTELLQSSSEAQKIIYIVPDQFEYETEKAVYRALDERGLTGRSSEVNIRTFSSLSEEILSTLDEKKRPADDIVKNIIMHRVIKENKNSLRALGAVADKPGFCHRMVQTVTMLKTAGIADRELSEENIELKLAELPDNGNGRKDIRGYSLITDKLRDVGLLYLAYNARLSEHYLDKLDFTSRAAELISSTDVFDDALVFVDCFNDFTNSQMNFLKNVVTYADHVTLGFAAELCPSAGRTDIFGTIGIQISRLKEQAEIEGEAVFLTDGLKERVSSEAVRFLSDNIYGEGQCDTANPPELITARDIHEELDYAAAKIRQLTTEGDMRYKDIAVLCTGPNVYGSYVESAFAKYDIPVFCDIPESILHQPPVNLIISLLNALKSFSAETVLSYVKTEFLQREIIGRDGKPRMAGLTKKDIDVFETYIYEWTIGTEALKSEFTFNDKNTAHAEEIRKAVVEPLLSLGQRLKERNGDEITEQLYEFIINEVGMNRAVAARCKNADGTVNSELISLYQRLWDTISGIFDSLWHGLKNDKISLAEYARLFRDICAETTLAKPPQYIDTVLVGDIDRTRAGDVKAVFIIGALYDTFPSPAAEAGIFSEFETELIRENIFNFDNTHKKEYSLKSAREQYCLSLYRVYKAVSLPSELLCVTCPETDISGRSVIRSEIFGEILRLFKNARIRKAAEFGEAFYCRSVKAARQRCAAGIYSDTAEQSSLREALVKSGQGEYVERLNRLRDIRRYGQSRQLKKHTAERLFGTNISATKIEALNACRFAYFCEQGMKIRQTTQRSFNSLFRGNAVHYVLQKVLERYCADMDEFFKLDRRALSGLVDFYLTEYRLNETSGDFAGDKRIEYLYNNIAVAACDVLIIIQAEFAARFYRPKLFELKLSENPEAGLIDNGGIFSGVLPQAALFTENITEAPPDSGNASAPQMGSLYVRPLKITADGREFNITGTIDRVDMFTDEAGRNYLRVVDYKTGRRQFSVHNAKYGVNVQMPLYLFALCDANKDMSVFPGGVAYTPAKISGAMPSRLSAFNLLSQSYKQSGMYILDPSTSEEMEHYADFIAKIISGGIGENPGEKPPTPDDILPEPDNRLTAEEFESFRSECLGIVGKRLKQLYNGDIEPVPLSYKEKENIEGKSVSRSKCACDYCRFKDICGNVGAKELVPDPPKKTKQSS